MQVPKQCDFLVFVFHTCLIIKYIYCIDINNFLLVTDVNK